MKRHVIIVAIALITAAAAVLPTVASSVAPGSDDRWLSLVPYIEILEDKGNVFTINDMLNSGVPKKFLPLGPGRPNYGYVDSYFWMRFTIDPSSLKGADRTDYYMEIGNPLFDMVEVYVFDSQGGLNLMRGGDEIPFSSRKILHRNFVFPVSLSPDVRQTVYVHIKSSGSAQLPIALVRSDYFIQKEQLALLAFGCFYGILLIIGIASIFFFFIEMDGLYLSYAAFIAGIILWHSSLDGLAFQFLWPEYPWWANKCIPFFIILLSASTVFFTRNYLSMKTTGPVFHRILTYMLVLSAVIMPAVFVIPYTLAVKAVSLYTAAVSALLFLAGFYYFIRGNRLARYFSGALALFLLGSIILALNKYGLIEKNLATDEAQRIGSIIQIIILYFALGERINIIKREKNDARSEARETREKYEIIVEESSDMIFSLDDAWNFISVNRAVKNHLKIRPEDVLKMNLLDLIYDENEIQGNESVRLLRNKLEKFQKAGKPLSSRMIFRSSFGREPVEMNVRLEYIKVHERNEILGRASGISEDTLLKYFVEEKQKYEIENYILSADELTLRLTRNLARSLSPRDVSLVRIALREILINAIEHGNLGLSFEEKSAAIADGKYFELIEKRRSDPVFGARKVSIDYNLDGGKARYVITDEGEGFDYAGIIEGIRAEEGPLFMHGRGIAIAMNIFDSVSYNRKGNKVTLVKVLR